MGTLKTINLNEIKVRKNFNARKEFDKTGLQELGQSIVNNGLIQPIVVTKDNKEGYYLVVGERRYRAAKMAKIKELPCLIEELSQDQALKFMNIENLQRRDLAPLEEADGIGKLLGLGLTAEVVAEQIGFPLSSIYSRNKLNFLIDEWKGLLTIKGILLKDALKIARLSDEAQRFIYENAPSYEKETDEKGSVVGIGSYYITKATDEANQELSKAPFDITDDSLIKNAKACTSCTLRSSCNPVLFPTKEEGETDLCLNMLCYKEKETQFLNNAIEKVKQKHEKFYLITTEYWTNTDNVIGRSDYEKVKKSEKGATPGVIVEGEGLGKVIYVRRDSLSQSGPMTEEQKAERKKVIRKNKIDKLEKSLSVTTVADAFHNDLTTKGEAFNKVLDFLISESLGFGQSREFIEYFTERYNWTVEVDYQDHMGRRKAIRENIEATPAEDKLRLLVDVLFKMKTVSEYDDSARTVAKSIASIDSKGLLKEATSVIDQPRKR